MSSEPPNSIDFSGDTPVPKAQGRRAPQMSQGPVSIRPAADAVFKEASKTRFSVSLLLLAAVVAASYWAGRDSAKGVAEAQIEAMRTVQDERLGQIVEALKAQAEISKAGYQETTGEIRGMRSQIQTLAGEVQVTKSMVSDRRN